MQSRGTELGRQKSGGGLTRCLTGQIVREVVKSPNRQTTKISGLGSSAIEGSPEIDMAFGGRDGIEIDPQQWWVTVEARNGYYENEAYSLGRRMQNTIIANHRRPQQDLISKSGPITPDSV